MRSMPMCRRPAGRSTRSDLRSDRLLSEAVAFFVQSVSMERRRSAAASMSRCVPPSIDAGTPVACKVTLVPPLSGSIRVVRRQSGAARMDGCRNGRIALRHLCGRTRGQ